MRIIFRDRRGYIFTTDGIFINSNHKDDTLYTSNRLKDIPYLENTKILYHYRTNTLVYPILYEAKEEIITKYINHYKVIRIQNNFVKDYILVNLNILENEDNS